MTSINYFLALRTLALRDVLSGDTDYHLRQVFRWYSREFHVPLLQVEELPMEHILQAYYECQYEKMEEDDREAERAYLMETDEQRAKRLKDDEKRAVEDLDYERRALAEIEQQKKMEAAKKTEAPIIAAPSPEVKSAEILSVGKKLPPSISMTFAPEDEFESRLEATSMGDRDDGNLQVKTVPSPPILK